MRTVGRRMGDKTRASLSAWNKWPGRYHHLALYSAQPPVRATMMDRNGSGADGVEIAGQLFKLEEPLTTTRGYGRCRMFTKVPAAPGPTNPADKTSRPVLYYPGHPPHIRAESSSHGSNTSSDGIDHASPSPPLSLSFLHPWIGSPPSSSSSHTLLVDGCVCVCVCVGREMYRQPSTFPAEPRQFRTHLTVDKAHTGPFRSGRSFSAFSQSQAPVLYPFV